MSDRIQQDSLARRAGRGLLRTLRGFFGRKNLARARDSLAILKEEFEAGKAEAGPEPPRRIGHRIVETTVREGPPPAPGETGESPSRE